MKRIRRKKSVRPVIKEWVEAILIAFILAMVIRTFFIQAFKIPSRSMLPTLKPGDRILVNKLMYGPRLPILDLKLKMLKQPKRADVIVFVYPASAEQRNFNKFKEYLNNQSLGWAGGRVWAFFKDTQSKDYIKRLVGLSGETVEIRRGDIYINGRIAEESQIRKNIYFNEGDFGRERQVVRVPFDSYYCLGDNSSSSKDSRYWGFVNKKFLVGKAFLIYWPLNRLRIIK